MHQRGRWLLVAVVPGVGAGAGAAVDAGIGAGRSRRWWRNFVECSSQDRAGVVLHPQPVEVSRIVVELVAHRAAVGVGDAIECGFETDHRSGRCDPSNPIGLRDDRRRWRMSALEQHDSDGKHNDDRNCNSEPHHDGDGTPDDQYLDRWRRARLWPITERA